MTAQVAPLRTSAAAPTPAYEVEVLSGLQKSSPTNLKFSCRWHSNEGCGTGDGPALDMVPSIGGMSDAEIHAVFGAVDTGESLEAAFTEKWFGLCEGVAVDIADGVFTIGTVLYTHVYPDQGKRSGDTWVREPVLERSPVSLANLTSPVDDGLLGNIVTRASQDPDCAPGSKYYTGLHLHQAAFKREASVGKPVSPTSVVQPNRDDNSGSKGIARTGKRTCISSSMWLWKIASATPDVTATDAPTTTCPPTGLALSTDAKDAAKLNLAYEIDQSTGSDGYPTSFKFELYRSSSLAGFCDADDDDGGPDPGGKGCVATVTKEVTVTSPLTSASFDTLKQGSWYRARGRGCVNAACGSWSAPIYAYLMEPWPGLGPPPSLNLSMARVAGDGIVGTGEKAAGFPISGSAQPGASVDLVIAEVTGGASGASATTTLPTVTVGADGTWSVQVPASISSTLSDGDYTVRATVTKGGVTATLTRTFVVDTTAPSVTYTAPATLTVGTAVSVSPSTTDADKSQHRYALASGSTLPPGLSLAASTGAISGTPTTARSTTRSVTIVVTDRAGNTQNVALTFPAVGSAPPPTPTPQQCSLTVTATTGGTASGSWSGNCGTTRSISATANSGYEFSNWSGAASGTSASTSVVVNQASMTATANFTRQCSLTVTAGTGGTVTPSATVTVDCGTSVSISASVDPGYRFKNWSGAASGTSLSTTVVVNQTSMTATANFQRQHTLSVTTAGGCGSASGGDTYDKGTVVTVTATEGANCKFANWFGGGLTGVTSTTATITMNSDKWTLAIFKRKRTLTTSVSPPGGGSVSASPSGPYYHGDSVTLTASSSTVVFWFTHWSGDCSGSSSSCSLTMNGNRSVTAHFTHNCDGNTGIGCSVQPQGQRPP